MRGDAGKCGESSQTRDRPLISEINYKEVMDINKATQDSSTNVFLTGAILLANFDYSGLADYAIKAAVGGVLWMGFKLATDYISEKIKRRSK